MFRGLNTCYTFNLYVGVSVYGRRLCPRLTLNLWAPHAIRGGQSLWVKFQLVFCFCTLVENLGSMLEKVTYMCGQLYDLAMTKSRVFHVG